MVTQEFGKEDTVALEDMEEISALIEKQKVFFRSGATLDLRFRLEQLKKLYLAIQAHEEEIYKAIHGDFKKSRFEVYGTEIGLVLEEIKYFLKHLPKLIRPEKVNTSLHTQPAKSYIYREPYGLSLIIGPWNYPFMLMFEPLAGSMAAGNCIILKPSELTSNTSALIKKIIKENYDESYVSVVEGGVNTTQKLLAENFGHIFFTGSEKVGRIVYKAAANHLTPCILELGGKSPSIVDHDADIDLAARRIVWGKLINGGQSCVAPDYLLAHKSIKTLLLDKIVQYIINFYGENPQDSADLPRVIDDTHFERLQNYLQNGKILIGGDTDADKRYIAPTVLDEITWTDPIMQDEIFGPILPVLEFDELESALNEIRNRPKPLALYYFSKNRKKQEKIIREVEFGGGCINDTMFQFGNTSIPFGGVGSSGIGKYHGKESFYAFSNSKGIVKKSNLIDIPFRYPPYTGKLKLLKLIFKL